MKKNFSRDSALPERLCVFVGSLRWPTWPRRMRSRFFLVRNKVGAGESKEELAMNSSWIGAKVAEESAKMVLLLLAKVTIMVV